MSEPAKKSGLTDDLTKELYKKTEGRFPLMQCAKAMAMVDGNTEKALVWIEAHPGFYLR